jgi:hypothetical protein
VTSRGAELDLGRWRSEDLELADSMQRPPIWNSDRLGAISAPVNRMSGGRKMRGPRQQADGSTPVSVDQWESPQAVSQ